MEDFFNERTAFVLEVCDFFRSVHEDVQGDAGVFKKCHDLKDSLKGPFFALFHKEKVNVACVPDIAGCKGTKKDDFLRLVTLDEEVYDSLQFSREGFLSSPGKLHNLPLR